MTRSSPRPSPVVRQDIVVNGPRSGVRSAEAPHKLSILSRIHSKFNLLTTGIAESMEPAARIFFYRQERYCTTTPTRRTARVRLPVFQ